MTCIYILFSKAKPADICNFYNNVESVYDHIIKRNNCYRIDARFENLISSGADKKVIGFEIAFGLEEYNKLLKGDNPVEAICDCALDILEASKKVLRDPATKKAVQIAVGLSLFLLCNDI